MDRPIADELLEVLQAHRENRLQPPPVDQWTSAPDQVQWADDEGTPEESEE